ncbi:MAG TPA: hypothetical protein VES59_02735 [Bacteroidota bacterium]|nr:hypothetical protein [Bacteroidota bacterium]
MIQIASLIIGALGFTFGVYKHFSSRKVAKITYEVTELGDFPLPDEFLAGLDKAPIMIMIKNNGNRMARSVLLHLKTRSLIKEFLIATDEKWEEHHGDYELTLRVPQLNPSDAVKVSLFCNQNDVHRKLLTDLRVTHSEGVAVDLKAPSPGGIAVTFDLFGLSLGIPLSKKK